MSWLLSFTSFLLPSRYYKKAVFCNISATQFRRFPCVCVFVAHFLFPHFRCLSATPLLHRLASHVPVANENPSCRRLNTSWLINFQPSTVFKELYPASMNDIRMWNIREMRICIEWGKTFDAYQRLSHYDQVSVLRLFCSHWVSDPVGGWNQGGISPFCVCVFVVRVNLRGREAQRRRGSLVERATGFSEPLARGE